MSVVTFLREIANKILASTDADKNIIDAIDDGTKVDIVVYAKDNLKNKAELAKEMLDYAEEIIDFVEKGKRNL